MYDVSNWGFSQPQVSVSVSRLGSGPESVSVLNLIWWANDFDNMNMNMICFYHYYTYIDTKGEIKYRSRNEIMTITSIQDDIVITYIIIRMIIKYPMLLVVCTLHTNNVWCNTYTLHSSTPFKVETSIETALYLVVDLLPMIRLGPYIAYYY